MFIEKILLLLLVTINIFALEETIFQKDIALMSNIYGMEIAYTEDIPDIEIHIEDDIFTEYIEEPELSPENFYLDIRGGVVRMDSGIRDIDSIKIPRMPFPYIEYKNITEKGNNSISGTIYLENDNGERFVAKESRIFLNPKTSYSDQWFKEVVIKGNTIEKADKQIYKYLRFSTSTERGNYSMDRLPEGSFYLSFTAWCHKRCGNKRPSKYFGTIEVDVEEDSNSRISAILYPLPQRQEP